MTVAKRILITGAGGFVGSHLLDALLAAGETKVFANVYAASSDLTHKLPSAQIIAGDLTDFAFTKNLLAVVRPDIIYHLAALSVVHDSEGKAGTQLTANMLLQYNLLEAMRQVVPTARLVAICSGNAYGLVTTGDLPIKETTPLRPMNPYAVSKIAQEFLALQYHLAYGLDIVLLRPFNHTGEGQTKDFVIPMLARQFVAIEQGSAPRIIVGNTETARDFTDVKDMVQAYMLAAAQGISGEIYNIGSGAGITIRQIITMFEQITEHKVEVIPDPSLMRGADVPVLICDASKFKTLTGWEPKIPLLETLSRILNYWRQQQ